MLTGLIAFPGTHTKGINTAQTATPATSGTGTTIIQGKITSTGILFIILEKTPGLSQYQLIQQPAHDPHFELILYNPNAAQAITLSIATWSNGKNGTLTNPQFQNITVQANQRAITTLQFSVQLTPSTEQMTMEIDGTGYQFTEQAVFIPTFPFYQDGEIGFFTFISLVTGITILGAFGIAILTLKRTKYFPPIQGLKLLFLTVLTTGYLILEIEQNYYALITQQWYIWEIPVFLLSLLIFLSYTPTHIKRGILLKFLADHNKGEAYTEILQILTAESENTHAPEGYRSANMQYLERKSYIAFLKRLIGIKTEIVFKEGQLPDQIAQPRKHPISYYEKMGKLRRLTNRKRDTTDYDFGYLIAQEGTIHIEKVKEAKRRPAKKYLVIPLSGHHSSYIEDFLAGIHDSAIRGERIAGYKEANAELKAQIMSGTYLNDQSIIDKIGTILKLQQTKETPKQPEIQENKEEKQDE